MTIIFYISAAIAVITTLTAITSKKPVHALLNFILSLLASGVIFFVLGAPFAAALVVIINAGAIMVLFVFIVMMVNHEKTIEQEKQWTKLNMWPVPCFLATVLLAEFIYVLLTSGYGITGYQVIQPKEVGLELFGHYLLVVELVSMVLLVGLLGAYHLTRENIAAKKGKL
jgi:NADH-quinone oxidoreductase subunit J